jgi:hypothetical protein
MPSTRSTFIGSLELRSATLTLRAGPLAARHVRRVRGKDSTRRVTSKRRSVYSRLQNSARRPVSTTRSLTRTHDGRQSHLKGWNRRFSRHERRRCNEQLDSSDPRSKAVPLRVTLALEGLQPGRYECQITVLDPHGSKVAFWRAPVVIVP